MAGNKEILLDIVNHTGDLGFIDSIKITGTDESTKIEAMDDDKTVIIKGELLEPNLDLKGEFGMNGLSVLTAFLNYPNYRASGASIEIKRTERNGELVPEEIIFSDSQKQKSRYRLMASELVPRQAKFLGTEWDVVISPTKSKISELNYMFKALSSYETFVLVKTVNGELRFWIGDDNSASHGSFIIFAKNVEGKLNNDMWWPAAQLLTILKHFDSNDVTMSFSSKGALMFSVKGTYANYKYILPARKR